jgi:hypothetical protein
MLIADFKKKFLPSFLIQIRDEFIFQIGRLTMNDMLLPTIEDLKKQRLESLMISEKAIAEHPNEYREIKILLRSIISTTVDIGDYYKTVLKLVRLLEKMLETGHGSIFHYYYKTIDPQQEGQARYFRANCLDFYQQIKCVDELRITRRQIRVIH